MKLLIVSFVSHYAIRYEIRTCSSWGTQMVDFHDYSIIWMISYRDLHESRNLRHERTFEPYFE
jgi:hypothetical protein